jgi:hypothetical protein
VIVLVLLAAVIAGLAGAPLWALLLADAFLVWLLWGEVAA